MKINSVSTNELPYPNMAAFYNNEEQTLYVKRDVGDSVAVAQCVAQELGHAQLSINSSSYSRADMGFHAVCIGYMLCNKYGIDTQNFAINRIPENIAEKDPKGIRFELSKMRNAMADVIGYTPVSMSQGWTAGQGVGMINAYNAMCITLLGQFGTGKVNDASVDNIDL